MDAYIQGTQELADALTSGEPLEEHVLATTVEIQRPDGTVLGILAREHYNAVMMRQDIRLYVGPHDVTQRIYELRAVYGKGHKH